MILGIYKINEAVYEGSEVTSVTLPGSEGELTILDKHAPLVTYLKKGDIRIKYGYDKEKTIAIERGVLNVDGYSKVTVLLD